LFVRIVCRACATESLDQSGRERRRRRGREHQGARALDQPRAQRRVADDERAALTERLAARDESSGHARDVDAALREFRDDAGAGGPEQADRVRLVDEQMRVVALADVEQRLDRRAIAVHAEHALGDDEAARRTLRVRQRALDGGDVAMRGDDDVRARGASHATTIDDRRVIGCVRDEQDAGLGEGLEQAEVRLEAGREQQRGFGAEPLRARAFGRAMQRVIPAEQTRRRGPRAVRARRVRDRRGDRGIACESEHVVRGEVGESVASARQFPA
jgi:hypothetical protein